MKTGNVRSVNVKASSYVFPVLAALVKCAKGQFGRTPAVLIQFLSLWNLA